MSMFRSREFREEDFLRLYRWQHHPDTRRFMLTQGAPTWEEHLDWCMARFADDTMAIYEADGGSVVAATWLVNTDRWWLSVVVAPEARGRGVGRWVIDYATRYRPRQSEPIACMVHRENVASVRAFESAGYVQIDPSTQAGAPSRLERNWVVYIRRAER